jgi:arginyl-tRNA synthetase
MSLYKWESTFLRNGSVDNVLEKLQPFTIKKDVLYLPLEKYGVDKELVLRRSNGTSLYATRDLAYHQYKTKNSDVSLDILGADHKLAAQQLSLALELSGNRAPEVVFYEFIDLPEGSMSTRRGVFISVDEFIEESIKHAKEELINRKLDLTDKQMDEVSEKIGTYETSIQPFEDCCTIFVAKHPVTKPNINVIKRSEERLAEKIDELLKTAIETVEVIEVK